MDLVAREGLFLPLSSFSCVVNKRFSLAYLLRRYVERHRSQIYFRVRIDAGKNEKYSCTDALKFVYLFTTETVCEKCTKKKQKKYETL